MDVLREILSVVRHLSPHIVDKEWLREVVFVIGVGHGLEVQGHGGTTLDIANLVLANRRVAVGVEELGEGLAVLGEERVLKAALPLLIVVNHVVGLWAEEATQLLVGENVVQHVHFINCGLGALVSDSCSRDQAGEHEVNFPERSMGEHHEGEASIAKQAACPHVVATVEARAHLVEVVTSTHAPFPVVGIDHVGHIVDLGWISLSFGL